MATSTSRIIVRTEIRGTPTTLTEILYYTATGTNGGPRVLSISTLDGDGSDAPNGGLNGPEPTPTPSGRASNRSISTSSGGAGADTISSNAGNPTAPPNVGGQVAPQSGSGSGSTESSVSSSGFSGGELAGAAIGCLIGGALIAFLVAFLIFRKREQRKSKAGAASYYQNNDSRTQRDVVAVSEKPSSKSSGSVMGWQAFLPQSADDRTIHNGVKTFFNLIDLHVDNYYRKAPLELDQRTREALAQIDSGKLPGRIDKLMQDDRLVLPVIKHCIADLLITRMSPLTYPETSLLPSHLSAIPTKLQASSLSSSERSAASQAYSQWRLLNAYLYPHPEEDPVYIDDREAMGNDIAELLSKAFAPWRMAGGDTNEVNQHERGLVATAGNLGILLMSQPSAFEFKWTADSGRSASGRSLIVLPGFWKNSDDQGKPLGQPQLLVSPVMMRV